MSLSLNLYDQPIYNDDSVEIPPYAIVQVTGFIDHKGKDWFKVKKPKEGGLSHIINGPFAIGAGKTGGGAIPTRSPGVHVLFEKDESVTSGGAPDGPPAGSPKIGDSWGPVKDKWGISKDGSGYVVVGDEKGAAASQPGSPPTAATKRVRVIGAGAKTTKSDIIEVLVKEEIPAAKWDTPYYTLKPSTFRAMPLVPYTGAGTDKFKPEGAWESNKRIRVACFFTTSTATTGTSSARVGKCVLWTPAKPFKDDAGSDLDPPVTAKLLSLDCNEIPWDGRASTGG